jgi:hypothetical protein
MTENGINYQDSHLNVDMNLDVKEFIKTVEEKHKMIVNS